ncbi:DinB family protein [candidate division KSB1 bacterium]|nr:DinB family protein [candidate division KSB1 bacterium]NIR72642.1 DinB family protein [candidate division KSB1 bacterium]NIS28192.1 DinB family protein [candidate division KSB1 bacterium]NIT75086.1 DinB family protein [candidate division KSB1 bacterium]NIU28871.1 DinB family protein [candidate division KSB1 bacterium]
MKEVERITDQLDRAFQGEAWHGPSISEALADLTSEQAAAKPIATAHSIWELVLHIRAWKDIVRKRLSGEKVEPTPEEDWPPVIDNSEDAWQMAVKELRESHEALLTTVKQLEDARLEEKVPGKNDSIYLVLHGLIQHDLYHTGQLVLLKKTLG